MTSAHTCSRCGNPRLIMQLSFDPVPRVRTECRECGTVTTGFTVHDLAEDAQ